MEADSRQASLLAWKKMLEEEIEVKNTEITGIEDRERSILSEIKGVNFRIICEYGDKKSLEKELSSNKRQLEETRNDLSSTRKRRNDAQTTLDQVQELLHETQGDLQGSVLRQVTQFSSCVFVLYQTSESVFQMHCAMRCA